MMVEINTSTKITEITNIKAETKTGTITNHKMEENHIKVEIKTSVTTMVETRTSKKIKTSKKEIEMIFVITCYLFSLPFFAVAFIVAFRS